MNVRLVIMWKEKKMFHLIHHNGVSPALVLLTHASLGQAAKLVAIRLGLAVAVELVEDKEDHRVTAITNHREHILSGVSRSYRGYIVTSTNIVFQIMLLYLLREVAASCLW